MRTERWDSRAEFGPISQVTAAVVACQAPIARVASHLRPWWWGGDEAIGWLLGEEDQILNTNEPTRTHHIATSRTTLQSNMALLAHILDVSNRYCCRFDSLACPLELQVRLRLPTCCTRRHTHSADFLIAFADLGLRQHLHDLRSRPLGAIPLGLAPARWRTSRTIRSSACCGSDCVAVDSVVSHTAC
jgi:hypothetical protein